MVYMRIGVAIPERLYRSSARLARRLGISRTVLYWRAIEEYLERHKDDESNPLIKSAGEIISDELAKISTKFSDRDDPETA